MTASRELREHPDGEGAALFALRIIARAGCENYTSGDCREDPSRRIGGLFTSEAWCYPCIATEALRVVAAPTESEER